MKFYVQLQEDNKVTDIITKPHANYLEVDLPIPLPDASYSGIYQLVGNELVYREDWDTRADGTAVEK